MNRSDFFLHEQSFQKATIVLADYTHYSSMRNTLPLSGTNRDSTVNSFRGIAE